MTTDRIDIHRYGDKLQHELAQLHTDQRLLPEHRRTLARFLSDARAGRTVRRGAKRRLSEGRCLKYLYFLRRFALELTGPYETVTVEDMERFIFGIEDGTITKLISRGETTAYSPETVLDYKNLLRKFYRWLLDTDRTRLHELTGWFDTSGPQIELRTFGLEEARRMTEGVESIQGAALIMTLFDGGFRPGELFNVRLHDLTVRIEPDGQRTCLVRVRHSKTTPRTISLPLATNALLRWVARHPGGGPIERDGATRFVKADSLLFTWSYPYCRNVIRKVGKAELGERVYLYRFRHASATFYARHLTEYMMCARFGWVMGSRAVRRYVDHSGVLAVDTAATIRKAVGEVEPTTVVEPKRAAFAEPIVETPPTPAPKAHTVSNPTIRARRLAHRWRRDLAQRPIRPNLDQAVVSPLEHVE